MNDNTYLSVGSSASDQALTNRKQIKHLVMTNLNRQSITTLRPITKNANRNTGNHQLSIELRKLGSHSRGLCIPHGIPRRQSLKTSNRPCFGNKLRQGYITLPLPSR